MNVCLRENADLFSWSASEIPRLDLEIACHDPKIDPTIKAVAQCRRWQSQKKTEATEQVVKDLEIFYL